MYIATKHQLHVNVCNVNYERCVLWTIINVGQAALPSFRGRGGGPSLMFGTLTNCTIYIK